MKDFRTKKSLGQNFIYDTNFLESILDKLNISKTDTVIEIGTGPGTLTVCIAKRARSVITYEIDKRLEDTLKQQFAGLKNVQLVFKDALEVTDFPPDFLLVANIPYYITTPIILKFLSEPRCREICILVQDEVARRIVAKPGTKDYGALSVTVQARADCKIIRAVPRGIFRPVPKVDSAFVTIKKVQARQVPLDTFDTLVKGMFAARRKTCLNALKQVMPEQETEKVLVECGIDPTCRPEQVTVEKFVKLSQYLSQFDNKK